jgi:hypothetical protein
MSLFTKFNLYGGNARRIAIIMQQAHRNKASTPINLAFMFVPQQVSDEIDKTFSVISINLRRNLFSLIF